MQWFNAQICLLAGSFFGLVSVALGAFAAHGLKAKLADYGKDIWATATEYQMYHALALILVAVLIKQGEHTLYSWAGFLFTIGILVFSGSLYVLALTQIKWLGAITPIGGTAMLAGWICLILAAVRS